MFCPECGGEYRPGFKRCVDCEVDLVETFPLPVQKVPAAELAAAPARDPLSDLFTPGLPGLGASAVPLPADLEARKEPAEAVLPLTPEERRLRLCELILVVSVGFLGPAIHSLVSWLNGASPSPETPIYSFYSIIQAAIAISVLAYVLFRQGRSLRSIGVTARRSDIAWALGIAFCARLLAGGILNLFIAYGISMSGYHRPPDNGGFLQWLAVVPSAAMEELIVRAYLMTEVAALSGSLALAVTVSVGFQCFYHLYQGVPAALYHVGTFFAYAVFYAYTRRATPVVLAHALENFLIMAR
jgi:membrane protease YdiL (CAAX protease family)